MAPYIGYDSDTVLAPGTVNTSTSLTIQGGSLIQTGGDVNFDSNTFFVDESEDRVGIGTTLPADKLDVRGGVFFGSGSVGFLSQDAGAPLIASIGATNLQFRTSGTNKLILESGGTLRPSVNSTYDLGSASFRWANIYSADLQLSNEGSANDIDGTWGAYTIQEGEEELYLINRRSGKKFKFLLEEVE
jgi:hypothetical protein